MARGGKCELLTETKEVIYIFTYLYALLALMDDTSSNATSVGVRLIRRRSQFSRRRLLSKNAAPFLHCLYLIYERKFYVRSHGKITRQWKKKP